MPCLNVAKITKYFFEHANNSRVAICLITMVFKSLATHHCTVVSRTADLLYLLHHSWHIAQFLRNCPIKMIPEIPQI